jgi:2-isopropylmalate synthase
MEIEIYDTTLRDGSQQEGVSLTVGDKLRVARLLDELGVAYIEGGWPGANEKDTEFFRRAPTELALSNAVLTAFGSTRRPGGTVGDDPQVAALLRADTEVVCVVGKTWDYHVLEALNVDLDEGVRMVGETIEHLRSKDRRVFFDAEHFFDGFESNPDYALEVIAAAADAGAERIVLCDTNGGMLPSDTLAGIAAAGDRVGRVGLGVHFHNDSGTAVASSITAVEAGVLQVQGCINGYGERTGNADLSILIPDFQIKMGRKVISGDLGTLTGIARHVAEIVNINLDGRHPYVGTSAFTHKAGLHTSALARRSDAYEHEDPAEVGNRTRVVVSELAGQAAVVTKAAELGLSIDKEMARAVVARVKEMEYEGYHFEAADGSFELLVRGMGGWVNPYFALDGFQVTSVSEAGGEVMSEATVGVVVDGSARTTVGTGVGPVNALDLALRQALRPDYPRIDEMHLADFKVRVLDGKDGTSARVRVFIETGDAEASWGTMAVHENIIAASAQALVEGLVVGLLRG